MRVILTNITDPERPSDSYEVSNLTSFTTFADLRPERVAEAAQQHFGLEDEGTYLILVVATSPHWAETLKSVTVEVKMVTPRDPARIQSAAILWEE